MGQVHVGAKVAYSLSFGRSETLLFEDAEDLLAFEVKFSEEDVRPLMGLLAYYEQGKVYVQTEFLYKQTRSNFKAIDWRTLEQTTYREPKVTNFIQIPIQAGYRLGNLKLGVGPVFSFILSENDLFDEVRIFEERRRGYEAGFGFNVGLKFYKLHVDLSYEKHFNRVADYVIFKQQQSGFGQSPGYLSIGLAYLII